MDLRAITEIKRDNYRMAIRRDAQTEYFKQKRQLQRVGHISEHRDCVVALDLFLRDQSIENCNNLCNSIDFDVGLQYPRIAEKFEDIQAYLIKKNLTYENIYQYGQMLKIVSNLQLFWHKQIKDKVDIENLPTTLLNIIQVIDFIELHNDAIYLLHLFGERHDTFHTVVENLLQANLVYIIDSVHYKRDMESLDVLMWFIQTYLDNDYYDIDSSQEKLRDLFVMAFESQEVVLIYWICILCARLTYFVTLPIINIQQLPMDEPKHIINIYRIMIPKALGELLYFNDLYELAFNNLQRDRETRKASLMMIQTLYKTSLKNMVVDFVYQQDVFKSQNQVALKRTYRTKFLNEIYKVPELEGLEAMHIILTYVDQEELTRNVQRYLEYIASALEYPDTSCELKALQMMWSIIDQEDQEVQLGLVMHLRQNVSFMNALYKLQEDHVSPKVVQLAEELIIKLG